ncbi:DMT family transporter [Parerythrobacter jejuensis]|uniref:EamA family transporter n=1 Tax=Parerythrobacter jejuensis TaxID=795812 RepID=A0A845AUE5_9SPHN|nr:DMT family transporter [Parerythrobacter jejuensis]MXP30464.1 EamA family transporter [Parerythrobacter jejuensis]MXP33224.1 EamA family transporter [Parerythrobacter jejuensis]
MHRDHPVLPFLLTFAGVGMLSLMDAFMKGASLAIGAYSAAVWRAALACLIIAPFWLLLGGRWPARNVLKLHLLRGTVSAFMALSFFYALTKLPIAEAIAISFIAPLIALYLAALLLGEQIRREAIFASILGFGGTIVIIGGKIGREPPSEDVWLGLGAILFSAMLYAYNFVVIRQQSQVAKPAEIATFHGGVAALVLGLGAPWFLEWPTTAAMIDLGWAALLTVGGAMALAWAYARAEAQALVPIEYSGFLWASLFGWLFFAEQVTLPTIAGTLLIVAGCWIAARAPTEQSTI